MNKKQNKGITLVALVITIIVLIILAGVSINAVMNGGLIQNAKDAKNEYTKGKKEEETAITDLEVTTDFATKVTQGYDNNEEDISKYTPYLFSNGYLTGVNVTGSEAEKVLEFRKKLPIGYEVYVSETEAEPANDDLKIATGMIVKKGLNKVGTIAIYGDVNCQGTVNANDITAISNFLSNNLYEEYQVVAADVNHDGYVDSADATFFENSLTGDPLCKVVQNKKLEYKPENIIVKGSNYYALQYINTLPSNFKSAYNISFNEETKVYEVNVGSQKLQVAEMSEKLADSDAKIAIYNSDTATYAIGEDEDYITNNSFIFKKVEEYNIKIYIVTQ